MTDSLAAHLNQLELQLLQPEVRRNPAIVAALLADDFREFGSSGRIYTKLQILDELAIEPARLITLTDFHCEAFADTIALVTYRSHSTLNAEPPLEALRSSLWVYRDHRWQMLFHQGTKL